MDLVEGVPLLDYVRPGWSRPAASGASETRRFTPPATVDGTVEGTGDEDGAADASVRGPTPSGDGTDAGSAVRVDRLRDALAQLARGLGALHDAGKVHRDVKPANILVEPGGRLVLVDFGLDGRRGRAARRRAPSAGTRAYMAPEQAAGQAVGAASDWYAVGVLLYEALTGRLPFRGREAERSKVAGATEALRPSTPRPRRTSRRSARRCSASTRRPAPGAARSCGASAPPRDPSRRGGALRRA